MTVNNEIVGALKPLGKVIDFETAPESRIGFIEEYCPRELDKNKLMRTFKKDIYLNRIVEVKKNIDIIYIESVSGKSDELYYFFNGRDYFHGDLIWSQFHPFVKQLSEIPVTKYIEKPTYFVGTRPNYTHQMVDFMPNLLHLIESNTDSTSYETAIAIGKENSIIKSCLSINSVAKEIKRRDIIKLSEMGKPCVKTNWKIRRIRFAEMKYVRFISIFESFKMLKNNLCVANNISDKDNEEGDDKKLLYLSRSDNRIQNQSEIQSFLIKEYRAHIAKDLHKLSFKDKVDMLQKYTDILMPPGSDNINGLCFSNENARLYQMFNCRLEDILENPFQSLAGLRYILPFLDRTKLIQSSQAANTGQTHVGTWPISELKRYLLR